jgi:acyl carrier protein
MSSSSYSAYELSMPEHDQRLMRCFTAVFPGLTPDEIRAVSAESSGVWDSLSAVTLAAVVQEEFSVDIDPEVLPQLDSFAAFQTYLHRLSQAGE